MKTPTRIQSADRVLRLLQALSNQPRGEASLSELARLLELNVSTVHHLVATLCDSGYLDQNPANRWYRFGPKMLSLAAAVMGQVDLTRESRPLMEQLASRLEEPVTLSVLDDDMALALYRSEPPGALPVSSSSNRRAPVYCTAAGKVLIADQPDQTIRSLLARSPMVARTPRTLTSPDSFLAEVAWVRQHAMAVDNEEWTLGARCVAVPVRSSSGSTVAALSIGGPQQRFSGARLDEMVRELKNTASELSRRLGYFSDTF